MKLITRAEAKARGLTRYFTGKPCSKGHLYERTASTGRCIECARLGQAKFRGNENAPRHSVIGVKEKAKAAGQTVYHTGIACPKGHTEEGRYVSNGVCVRCAKDRAILKVQKNPEAKSIRRIASYNANKQYVLEQTRQYRKDNPHMGRAKVARRRANELKATPVWSDLVAVKKVYELCPPDMQVDHVVPLQGELVCGLHVHWNLAYLDPSANAAKCNRWDPWEDSKQFD